MAGTDHSVILDRLIEMIKANSTLWTDDVKLKAGKLLAVKFGEPEYDTLDARQIPYCYVATPSNRMEDTRESFGSSVSGTSQPYQSTYQIGVVCQNNKTEDTQRQLYGFLKTIRDVIEANPRLGDPANIATDTKVARTRIVSVERLVSQRGKEKDLGLITIQCQLLSQFTMDIAGLTGIPLLSKPVEREIEITENIYDTARIRKTVSPISETHFFVAEIEYVESVVSTLRTQKRARTTIPFTITRPSGDTVQNGRIVEISNGAGFDQLETAVIQIEIFH